MKTAPLAFSAATLLVISGVPGLAQTTGVPGSPSATTTIDGKYLPPPPAPFGGTINLDAKDSKPLAADCGAAQKCAQRLADHDR
jgi:arylsulfatase